METSIPSSLMDVLKRHRYHLVGQHSAVKRCRWLHETLVNGRPCYKQKFYGIKTHQCIQMTPALFSCTQKCLFCWRAQSGDLDLKWEETKPLAQDSPEDIIENCVKEQHRILSGYKVHPRIDRRKLMEAHTPRQVAISLTGEPTLYERLGELIRVFHHKGFTTFLVSNGTVPSALKNLDEEPSQLYISACAPDKPTFQRVCRPHVADAWHRLNESLELLPSFKCPTVIRTTLARGLNMLNVKGYARLIEKANPTYIEPKAYMHVGFSRLRVGGESMPSHSEIRLFSSQLAEETGYDVLAEAPESRVVLLSRLRRPIKFSDT